MLWCGGKQYLVLNIRLILITNVINNSDRPYIS